MASVNHNYFASALYSWLAAEIIASTHTNNNLHVYTGEISFRWNKDTTHAAH